MDKLEVGLSMGDAIVSAIGTEGSRGAVAETLSVTWSGNLGKDTEEMASSQIRLFPKFERSGP